MDPIVFKIMILPLLGLVAVVVWRGIRAHDPPQKIVDGVLWPAALVFFCLPNTVLYVRLVSIAGLFVIGTRMVWKLIVERRERGRK